MPVCPYESRQLPAQLQTPELSQWAKLPSRAEREAAPLSAEAASAAADTYFQLYTQRFDEEGVRDALACIPQVYSHCVDHLARKCCARLLAGKTGRRLRNRLSRCACKANCQTTFRKISKAVFASTWHDSSPPVTLHMNQLVPQNPLSLAGLHDTVHVLWQR